MAGDVDMRLTLEFELGYDPNVSHPANEVQLANRQQFSTAGADSWLAIDDNDDIYFTGSVLDPYVEKISCGR